MKPWLVSILVLGALVTCGCSSAGSSPSASPPTQVDCELSGGVWRADLASCKYPAPKIRSY